MESLGHPPLRFYSWWCTNRQNRHGDKQNKNRWRLQNSATTRKIYTTRNRKIVSLQNCASEFTVLFFEDTP